MSKIYTRTQAEAVIAEYLAAEKHPGYNVANLTAMTKKVKMEDGSKMEVTSITAGKDTVDWNRSSDSIRIYSVAKVRQGAHVKPVKRFSFSELHLTVNAVNEAKPAAWLYKATFAYNVASGHWACTAMKGGKQVFFWLDGELEEMTATEWVRHSKNALVYNDCSTVTGSYASAGNLKMHKLVCSCMNEKGVNALERSMQTTGGISFLYTNPGRLTSPKAIAQANVRISAPYTQSFGGPEIRVAAFFMGKWELTDKVTGKKYSGADGYNFNNSALYERWMKKLGHEVVTEEAVMGIATQNRPFSFKTVGTSVPAQVIADMVLLDEGMCHAAEVVVLRASSITREQQDNFSLAIESKGKKGEFAGKTVVVIYDDSIVFDPADPASYEQIDVLGDLNAYKAEQDLRKSSCLNILKLFRKSVKDWSNGMGTSTQFLQSLYPVCPHLKALVRVGFRAQMGRSVEDITREEAKSVSSLDVMSCIKKPAADINFDEESAMELTDSEKSVLANNDYGMNVVNLAELLAPAYAWEKDAALFKDELKAAYKAGKSRADRVRVPINGTDFVLVPDFGAMYGVPVLGLTADKKYQVWSTLANKLGVNHAAMIKYPKCHINEMSSLEYAHEEDVAAALAGNKHAAKIAFLYATLSEAAEIAPASEDFMNQNAGLDFDGDEGFNTEVLTAEEAEKAIAGIDWSLGWKARETYVKIQIAYCLGLVHSLVVKIDADAEDKSARKVDKKLAGATEDVQAAVPATVNHDELWKGITLGQNMPSREEVETWGIVNPGNEASIKNILNANLDVGTVTNIHLVFSHLYFMLKKMENKADAELNADELKTVDVSKAIMLNVFENQEVKGKAYQSLFYESDESGLWSVEIDINKYHDIRQSARTMELTRDNMMRFFYDLVANCRMAQEMTIDACKTLQIVANLDYAVTLRKYVKILSKQKDMDIDFAYGDRDSHINYVAPELGEETRIVTHATMNEHAEVVDELDQIIVRDYTYDMKVEGYKAIVAAVKPLLTNKPAFDADLIESITNIAVSYPEAHKLADFFKVVYMHLNTAQEQAVREATMSIVNPKEKELAKAEVKADHAGFFNGIGNTIRRGLKNFRLSLKIQGLDADEIAALEAAMLISLAYTAKNGTVDSKLSSFAYRVLPEEYMRFILAYVCADDDRVARYTEDALSWAHKDVTPGQAVTFSDGKAYLYGDCVAEAKDGLNGEYTLLKNDDGRMVASTDVFNLMPIQKDSNTLVVETKLNEWMSSHMDSFLKEIAPDADGNAAYVQLWAHKTQGQDGDELHDVIAVEDEGEAYGVGYFHVGNKDYTFDVYNGIRGQVTNVTVLTRPGTNDRIAILLLENCEPVADLKAFVEPVVEDLPVDAGWKAAAAPAVAPKTFKSAAAPVAKAEEKTEEKPGKFATAKIQDPDMDMFEEWDYGEE